MKLDPKMAQRDDRRKYKRMANGKEKVDPTANVIALTEAANKRQDDLRELSTSNEAKLAAITGQLVECKYQCQKEVADLRDHHRNEIGSIREQHQIQLRTAESQRLDAIRQVDREDVSKTAVQIAAAVKTLEITAAATAETLRKQVSDTALAAQTTFAAANNEMNKRLSAVELALSAGAGGSKGMQQMWGVLIAVVMFIVALAAIIIAVMKP